MGELTSLEIIMTYPYSNGWPLWPFTRLSPKEMEKLLKTIEGKRQQERLDDVEEAPL